MDNLPLPIKISLGLGRLSLGGLGLIILLVFRLWGYLYYGTLVLGLIPSILAIIFGLYGVQALKKQKITIMHVKGVILGCIGGILYILTITNIKLHGFLTLESLLFTFGFILLLAVIEFIINLFSFKNKTPHGMRTYEYLKQEQKLIGLMVFMAILIVLMLSLRPPSIGYDFTPDPGKISRGFTEFAVGTMFNITTDGTASLDIYYYRDQSKNVTINSATVGGKDCNVAQNMENLWTLTCTGLPGSEFGNEPYGDTEVFISYSVEGKDYTDTGSISGRYE